MTASFGSLKAPATDELDRQIQDLAPNAMKLVAFGMGYGLASAITRSIATGKVDLGEWRAFGLDQQTAVEIASAISARHAKPALESAESAADVPTLNLSCYLPPLDPPEHQAGSKAVTASLHWQSPDSYPTNAIAPHLEPVDRISALSLLHTLSQAIDSGRGDPTLLVHSGFSVAAAEELANLINCSRS